MTRLIFIFCFLCSSHSAVKLFAQTDTILLFHPTVANIHTFSYIFSEVIDSVPINDYHFIGVYHESEQYDYKKSFSYIEEMISGEVGFSLQCIKGAPEVDELYKENIFYGQFYKLFNKSIGAIFTGGPDMPPALYNEDMHLLTEVTDPWRHFMEVSALSYFLGSSKNPMQEALLEMDPDYMVLGICLGMQSMNVATGGTMIQDIPSEVYRLFTREDILKSDIEKHRNYFFDDPSDSISLTSYHFHPVEIEPGSRFNSLFNTGSTPYVLSSHHQAIEVLGSGLVAVAYSLDGKIIEAVEHKKYQAVFGVQFHTEKTGLYNNHEIFYLNVDHPIQFQSFCKEKQSDDFHIKFWNSIYKLLIDNRESN